MCVRIDMCIIVQIFCPKIQEYHEQDSRYKCKYQIHELICIQYVYVHTHIYIYIHVHI